MQVGWLITIFKLIGEPTGCNERVPHPGGYQSRRERETIQVHINITYRTEVILVITIRLTYCTFLSGCRSFRY